jgi:hypothetical protein
MKGLRALLILAVGVILAGCSSEQEGATTSQNAAAVSSIPWNKPASWEGAGALGGFMPQGGH